MKPRGISTPECATRFHKAIWLHLSSAGSTFITGKGKARREGLDTSRRSAQGSIGNGSVGSPSSVELQDSVAAAAEAGVDETGAGAVADEEKSDFSMSSPAGSHDNDSGDNDDGEDDDTDDDDGDQNEDNDDEATSISDYLEAQYQTMSSVEDGNSAMEVDEDSVSLMRMKETKLWRSSAELMVILEREANRSQLTMEILAEDSLPSSLKRVYTLPPPPHNNMSNRGNKKTGVLVTAVATDSDRRSNPRRAGVAAF
ncbi:hypothetical protein BGX29_001852, partial [Mortierella sp. GBA35]